MCAVLLPLLQTITGCINGLPHRDIQHRITIGIKYQMCDLSAVIVRYEQCLPVHTCIQVSLTFDPFSVLSVPIPKKKQAITVTYLSAYPRQKPIQVGHVLMV